MKNEKMISERIIDLIHEKGSLHELSRQINISPSYLCRLRDCEKINPSDSILKKLGLKKKVSYILIDPDK